MSYQMPPLLTRRDEIARVLRDEIVSGALPPGMVLKDAAIAERLGSSITPVREALTQLAGEGLIDMPPNRAKRVAILTRQNAVELCEAIELLAVALFNRGVQRVTRSDLLAMRDALEVYRSAGTTPDFAAHFQAAHAFTDVVIRAGGNAELRRMLHMIMARFERLLSICYREGLLSHDIGPYQAIFTALEQGDYAAASQAYHLKIQALQQAIEQLPIRIWNS